MPTVPCVQSGNSNENREKEESLSRPPRYWDRATDTRLVKEFAECIIGQLKFINEEKTSSRLIFYETA